MTRKLIITGDLARESAIRILKEAPVGSVVRFSDGDRTADQNAAQWPYLEAFAKQKQLCLNGVNQWVTKEDWKDVLTGCWKGEMRVATFDGKMIMLPQRTSRMGKKAFSTWLEFLIAMAATSGVVTYPEDV